VRRKKTAKERKVSQPEKKVHPEGVRSKGKGAKKGKKHELKVTKLATRSAKKAVGRLLETRGASEKLIRLWESRELKRGKKNSGERTRYLNAAKDEVGGPTCVT